MKALTKYSFFVLSGLLAFTTLRAQTADDIVNKYVSAIGGKDLVNSVKSLSVESSMNAMGNDAPGTITILVGQGYKTEYDFAGTKIITAITPTGGWQVNPYAGAATPTALPEEQLKGQKINLQLDPLANYAANGYKVELTGKDTAAYKLKLTGNGVDITYYVNMKTYLIDKIVSHTTMGGQEGEITISFSDYRKLDNGLLYPFATNLELPQVSLAITAKKVTVNPTIDPAVFNMPK
jgi:outer membrane lipoprotein-sorting protein